MRFTVSRELARNKFFCGLLLLFFVQCLLFLFLNIVFEKDKWGLSPAEITTKIHGDEAEYIQAMEISDIVTHVHIELFLYPFLLVMCFLVYFHSEHLQQRRIVLAVLTFTFCMLNSISPFLVIAKNYFSIVKVLSFWGLTMLTMTVIVANIVYLAKILYGSSCEKNKNT